jgi:hypothetical protein
MVGVKALLCNMVCASVSSRPLFFAFSLRYRGLTRERCISFGTVIHYGADSMIIPARVGDLKCHNNGNDS